MKVAHIQDADVCRMLFLHLPLLDNAKGQQGDQSSSRSETSAELATSQTPGLSPNPYTQQLDQKDVRWSAASWESPLPANAKQNQLHLHVLFPGAYYQARAFMHSNNPCQEGAWQQHVLKLPEIACQSMFIHTDVAIVQHAEQLQHATVHCSVPAGTSPRHVSTKEWDKCTEAARPTQLC